MHRSLLAALVVASGCIPGGQGAPPDGGASPPDTRPPDASPPTPVTCGDAGTGRLILGELVELSSSASNVLGIEGATFTQRGGSATDTTRHDGSFELCAEQASDYAFDVDAPADHLDAILALDERVFIHPRDPLSVRTASVAELSSFYTARGMQLDLTKPQVLVLLVNNRWEVKLEGVSHGPAYAASDEDTPGTLAWSPGGTGRYVLFPNVDSAEATVRITSPTPFTAPIAPGKLTIAVIAEYFCFTGSKPCI